MDTSERTSSDIDVKLLEILVCPVSRQKLAYDRERQELVSQAAGLAWPSAPSG